MTGFTLGGVFPALQSRITEFAATEWDATERASQIEEGVEFIVSRLRLGRPADLMFVCTHNSRRSQLAQVWSAVAASALGLYGVHCYSGGTEVTACNERTVASLRRFGFEVEQPAACENPKYAVRFADGQQVECDSKLYTQPGLEDFAAMMCCADVDEKCPLVPGAAIRIAWHYDDPKSADGTPEEEARYDERSWQIGRDMWHMLALSRHQLGAAGF